MNEYIVLTPALFFLGAVLGSFLNVVALRFISGQEIIFTPSHCPACAHKLAWYELVPIVSFIILSGRCRSCAKQISAQYPIIEFVMGLTSLLLFLPSLSAELADMPPELAGVSAALADASLVYNPWQSAVVFVAIALLLVLIVIDSKTFLLPDMFVISLGVVAFVFWLLQPHVSSLLTMAEGLAVGAGFLYFLWLITKGQGIGFGDIKLMLALGFLLGFTGAIVCLLLSFIIGGAVGSYLLLTKKATLKTAIPFGPYLAGVGILLLVVPGITTSIIDWLGFS